MTIRGCSSIIFLERLSHMKIIQSTLDVEKFIVSHQLEKLFDKKMIHHLELHCFDTKERVLEEGDFVTYLYLVIEGEARVMPSSTEGKSGFLEYILPMDIIGDMEYFTKSTYVHSVDALTPCKYLAIPVKMIEQQFGNNPRFYRFICENMASKMKRTSARYSRALLYPLKSRLANFLLDESLQQNSDTLILHTVQIAEYFAVTPRHLRRVLSELEKASVIKRSKNHILLLNKKDLESMSTGII